MSSKGGYIILDLGLNPIDTSVGTTVPGIYESIEGNIGKPILLSGLSLSDGLEVKDQFINVRVSGDDFVFEAGDYQVIVDDDDLVKVSTISPVDPWSPTIFDLQENDLTMDGSILIPGLFTKIRKAAIDSVPILFTNFTLEIGPATPAFVSFTVDNPNFLAISDSFKGVTMIASGNELSWEVNASE